MRHYEYFSGDETNFLGITKVDWFWITFFISVFSGSMGIAKFLKLGPCQIVSYNKFHCGFLIIFISIAPTLIGKGLVLAFSLLNNKDFYVVICLIWVSTCVLPQFILVSKIDLDWIFPPKNTQLEKAGKIKTKFEQFSWP